MENYDVVIDYYDAFFSKHGAAEKPKLGLATQAKLCNILTRSVLSVPEGLLKFTSIIKPETHFSNGFYKPWEWFDAYVDYPDVFLSIISQYYDDEMEQSNSNKSKRYNEYYNKRSDFPFTANNGNKFINLYDPREVYKVRELSKFLIKHQLNKVYGLIVSLAYINVLSGAPKLAMGLYELAFQGDFIPPTSGFIQHQFAHFVYHAFKDLKFAFNNKYDNHLITKNIIYSNIPDGKCVKSLKMFMSLLVERHGEKSLFVDDMTPRKLISNLKSYASYINSSNKDNVLMLESSILTLSPLAYEYCGLLSKLDTNYEIYCHYDLVNLRRNVHAGNFLSTEYDNEKLLELYNMDSSQRKEFNKNLEQTFKLLVG